MKKQTTDIEILARIASDFASGLTNRSFNRSNFKKPSEKLAFSIASKLNAVEILYLLDKMVLRDS